MAETAFGNEVFHDADAWELDIEEHPSDWEYYSDGGFHSDTNNADISTLEKERKKKPLRKRRRTSKTGGEDEGDKKQDEGDNEKEDNAEKKDTGDERKKSACSPPSEQEQVKVVSSRIEKEESLQGNSGDEEKTGEVLQNGAEKLSVNIEAGKNG